MKSRALAFLVALVLAIVGTSAVLAYVNGADQRALKGMAATTVLEAGSQIPAGTSAGAALRQGMLHPERLPASSVPLDALRTLTPQLSPLVVSTDVPPGSLLTRPMLITALPVTGGLQIPNGMVAVTINVCAPEDVAGFVQPGAEVEVFNTSNGVASSSLTANPNCQASHSQQSAKVASTSVVLPKVKVLAVGQSTSSGGPLGSNQGVTSSSATGSTSSSSGASASGSNTLVTFIATQAEAEKLILTTVTGLPYLALVTPAPIINAASPGATASAGGGLSP